MIKVSTKIPSLPSKKFYFFDYFIILLMSVEKNTIQNEVFNTFKLLKQEYRLGESKYKKLEEVENPSSHQQRRYKYTFSKVLDECKDYGLLSDKKDQTLHLTNKGKKILSKYRSEGPHAFNVSVFKLMEEANGAFRTLVEFLYRANSKISGVLIFPHYSPLELHFVRKDIQTTTDMTRYMISLVNKLQGDILKYLQRNVNLISKNEELLKKVIQDGLLKEDSSGRFNPKDYNKIIKRIRDFWLNYFLKELYKCPYSMSSFDLWVYRARQVDIIQATESYPFINGKIVYPTSVILDHVNSDDFSKIYQYTDGKSLFVHEPTFGDDENSSFKDKFVDTLVKGYFELKRQVRYNFVNLATLREIVCFRLKISIRIFEKTLNEIYRLNLSGELKVHISLEVDKLPEETSTKYMKREPVMINGSYRNIIAIDVSRGGQRYEQVEEKTQTATKC